MSIAVVMVVVMFASMRRPKKQKHNIISSFFSRINDFVFSKCDDTQNFNLRQ